VAISNLAVIPAKAGIQLHTVIASRLSVGVAILYLTVIPVL